MKGNEGGADGAFGPPLGQRAVWDAASPDHECDCPGPPPRFHLPPPPRPFFLLESSDCWENSTAPWSTCEALPVIDAEYRHSPAVPSLAIILTVAAAVVVFLLVGTFLVLLKRRKMQNLFPRKSSPQSRCDGVSANGVIYEDLTNVRPRILPSHCPPPGQTTLPSIEMMNVGSYPEHPAFAPVLLCSTSPAADAFDPRELFNPVYEELSNGSGEGGETDSEGGAHGAASDDDFAEDELSLGGEADGRRRNMASDRDADSDSDDNCKFLENPNGLPSEKRRRFGGAERRKAWRGKAPSPPAPRGGFHEDFLLKRILQIYPDVTGMGLQYSCGNLPRPEDAGDGRREAPGRGQRRRPKPEVFSTFGQGFQKNQSQDSSLGSDSGYSNNTSGGKPSARGDHALRKCSQNTALS